MVVGNNKIDGDKNEGKLLAILIAMDWFSSCVVQYSMELCKKLFLEVYTSIIPLSLINYLANLFALV
jgi:hypothetical protein